MSKASNPKFKFCNKCLRSKPTTEFYKRGGSSPGFHYMCKRCMKKYYREKWKNRTKQERATKRKQFRKWYDVLRNKIIKEYGGVCVCCGEEHIEFLSIDHIGGGGTKHRKVLGGGTSFFLWLKENDFPKDNYRLLCMNCNWARGRYGYCPHENEGNNP